MEKRNLVKRISAFAFVCLLAGTMAYAEPAPRQHAVQSWHGLTGLYVVPTARTLNGGQWGVGYNESKHVEWIGDSRFVDRQVRSSVTYGVTDGVEVYGGYLRDLFLVGGAAYSIGSAADGTILQNQSFNQFGFKWRFLKETKSRPAVAIAVRDLFNQTQDITPLENVGNGRKVFLLATKRVVEDKSTGRFLDATLGLTNDTKKTAGLFGVELALSPTMSYIAEGMWDAPYANFRDIYLQDIPADRNNHAGRFIFDMGLRFYPDLLPGLTIDTGFVADGQPEFSFGFNYTAGM